MDVDQDEVVETEEQFWEELDDIVSTPCRTLERIDDTLRTWLSLVTTNKEPYVQTEHAVIRASTTLLSSSLFEKNASYIRRQITYSLLEEDDPFSVHLVVDLLLLDGRRHEETYNILSQEGVFLKLVHLVKSDVDDARGCHRQLLELLYEMSRIQQIPWSQLTTVDDDFILYLFQIVESLSGDVTDPYHYSAIRALLVLNEQYMVSTHDPSTAAPPGGAITNRVLKVLSIHGNSYKTFGENAILLLNRESETSLQLLILKLFYLLFTTPSTYEYFYTNDLHVLVDILLRNMLDLPASTNSTPNAQTTSLRHTYLRVLHPLLANTQLNQLPYYKREEICRILHLITEAGSHFEQPDDTTIRLARRCLDVPWLALVDPGPEEGQVTQGLGVAQPEDLGSGAALTVSEGASGGKVAVRHALGLLQPPEARESSLSVQEIASQKEKPGILTPSRARHAAVVTRVAEAPVERSPFDDT